MEILVKGTIPPTDLEIAESKAPFWHRKKWCGYCGTKVLLTADDVLYAVECGWDSIDWSWYWRCPVCDLRHDFWWITLPMWLRLYAKEHNHV